MATKKTPSKQPSKTTKPSRPNLSVSGPRRIKPGKYESFRLQKRLKFVRPEIPGAFRLLFRAIKMLCKDWKLFGSMLLIYLVLNLLLVQGLGLLTSGDTLGNTKSILNGASGAAETAGSLFLLLVSNGSNGTNATSAYQFVLLLFISLAIIWVLRQRYAGFAVRIRDGFYQGMAPMVQFVLVLLCIGFELVPATIGIVLYTAVHTNGIASGSVERALWVMLTAVLVLMTLYMLAGTIFALYIVTLPEMTPLRAMQSANQLVSGRRWLVIRKLIFLPIAVFSLMAILILPFLLFWVKAGPTAFFVVSAAMIGLVHTYIYGLYRELLNE